MNELDRRLAALSRTEIAYDLHGLENAVWTRIDARAQLSFRPLPTRLAAATCAGIAMMTSLAGVATASNGGRVTVETVAFAVHAPLALSTILTD